MEEEEEEVGIPGGGADGPGSEWKVYEQSEQLLDKLKLLHYEKEFLAMHFRPIQRHYFVSSTNVGEQFFQFTSLAAWLIKKGGNEQFEMPQEFDDPNATTANILAELRAKNVPVDFSANKLRQGAGELSVWVLDTLADLALVQQGFQWQRMIPPPEEDDDVSVDAEEGAESENESHSDPEWAEDDDDAAMVDLAATATRDQEDPSQNILRSDTDVVEWRAEVQRVTPLLKITIRQDAKDWRMHLEQMHTMHKTMNELIGKTNPQLEQIVSDLERSMERIESREKSLNQQMSHLLSQFRQAKDGRAEVAEKYKSASVGVIERTEALQRISEDIDQIKQQIEEQGAKTSDGAPLVRVKQALLKMEADMEKMSVQIGVVEHGLLQAQLSHRVEHAADSYGAG